MSGEADRATRNRALAEEAETPTVSRAPPVAPSKKPATSAWGQAMPEDRTTFRLRQSMPRSLTLSPIERQADESRTDLSLLDISSTDGREKASTSLVTANHGGSAGTTDAEEDFSVEDLITSRDMQDSPVTTRTDEHNNDTPSTTESEVLRRELEESEALARQLMAEEAMSSYAMSVDFLRNNSEQYTEEDMAALQAAMAEEDPEADYDEEDEGDGTNELSYDTMLRLGERMGDVKQERWALVAQDKIEELPKFFFGDEAADCEGDSNDDDSAIKCLVCQCPYEKGDCLRRLPCGHRFHVECVDQWLATKDVCPYCRQSIQK